MSPVTLPWITIVPTADLGTFTRADSPIRRVSLAMISPSICPRCGPSPRTDLAGRQVPLPKCGLARRVAGRHALSSRVARHVLRPLPLARFGPGDR